MATRGANKVQSKMWQAARIVVAGLAAVLMMGAISGCGAEPPPAEGSCHEWREWVPPQQDEEGEWQSGYCRDRE